MKRKIVVFALLLVFLTVSVLSAGQMAKMPSSATDGQKGANRVVDIGNGQTIEVGPGEELHRFVLSDQGWVEWNGIASPRVGAEYGNSTTIVDAVSLRYNTDNTTVGSAVNVSLGPDWEAYHAELQVTQLTENRTWVHSPDFATQNDWTYATTGAGGSSTPAASYNSTGDASGGPCVDVEINSNSQSAPYGYDAGDYAYATQTMTVDRGPVVWAGLRLDYWADTRDDTHYGMTGSFAVYARVEGSMVWQLVFDDIGAEETWFDSGLVSVPSDIFSLPSVSIEVGLWSKQNVGYDPDIAPRAKFDNVELYVKTLANPSDVNLKMNEESVLDGTTTGTGSLTQDPQMPWTGNPIPMNFSWWPTPTNPTPNRPIIVEFDVNINMFARRHNALTVYDISPTAYGETFTVQNGTDAQFANYFYADIPEGYVNRYFFNMTIPSTRDVFNVSRPLTSSQNLTSGWSGGDPGDGYLNVSAYEVTTEAGRYGYWRILSTAPNMITDLKLYDPNTATWSRTVELRAGNSSQVRVYAGSQYTNSVVNITIFAPDGSTWYTENATVDALGYATSSVFVMDGSTAPAGNWMVQAYATDEGASGSVQNVGFFKRPFTVRHTSNIVMSYLSDAVSTWVTNTTYENLVLVILKVNDTDSNVLVPGGTMSYTWAGGSGTFDDSGNGEYTKVIDTSTVPGKGQFTMDISWSRTAYDVSTAQIIFNVYYDATLESPDYPGISNAVGLDQTFRVNYTNVNGTGITGATITCNWTASYTVAEVGGGLYDVTLSTAGIPIGEYPILVQATAPFVVAKSLILYVDVREIYNTISYTANQLSIPVGESRSFRLTWTDTDSNVPVTGANNSIVCNWTSFHTTGEKNYTVIEVSPGEYEITLFTEDDDPVNSPGGFYTVQFDVSRPNYQNHTFIVEVQIRSHDTLFVLDKPVDQTPYTGTVIVLVEYRDLDLGVGIDNLTGYVRITVSSPTATLTWSVSSSTLGTGHYNITFSADQWGTIGWKDITIEVRWTGPVPTYYNGTIHTSVRILGTDTSIYLEQAPTAKYYLENFTFTVVYWDKVNSTRISNSTGDVFVYITPITAGHPVTQADFVVSELGGSPGTYEFRLNTSRFLITGTFEFRLNFTWRSGQAPLYENRSMTVSLVVLERLTYLDYVPIEPAPFGESATFYFSYVDSLSSERIANSSAISISLAEGWVSYSLSYDDSSRFFTMLIDTQSLGGVGTFTLHLNIGWSGEPYYRDLANQSFTLRVTLRNTQLTHGSFEPGQWGMNVTVVFTYTDLISGSSSGMTGTLTLNASLAGYYTVTYLGNGQYEVVLNTTGFPSDGVFTLNATIVYTGSNYEADASDVFGFAVSERATQLAYEIPDLTYYLENATFVVTYTDDNDGSPIDGATVVVSCSNSSVSPLVEGTDYWVVPLGNGQFRILVDSESLGSLGAFPVNVSLSWSGVPFYAPAHRVIYIRVGERPTQILITQTPGNTPFLENVTFQFKFSDFLTGQAISITKSNIALTFGPAQTPIGSGDYSLASLGTEYAISFNSTLLNSTHLVSNVPIYVTIDKTGQPPYYAARNATTYATTTERPTQILFPLVGTTPYGDNISIVFEYTDFISGAGISGASVSVAFLNISPGIYNITDNGDGSYLLEIPTSQFLGTGSIFFNLTASRPGYPYYAERSAYDIRAVIRLIQTTLVTEAPSPASLPVGALHVVNVTLYDSDHDTVVTGATVETNWTSLYGTPVTIMEIGGGVYQLTINTTGLLAQQYYFAVWATKTDYRQATATVMIQPAALTVDLTLSKTTYYAEWGEFIDIRADVVEALTNTPVPEMTVELQWNGTVYPFVDLGNGTYVLHLDTATQRYGTYEPVVVASKQFYQPRSATFTLVVTKASGSIVAMSSVVDVYPSGLNEFWVYLNATARNVPIEDANVTLLWGDKVAHLYANGTPGYYVGYINSTGFAIGDYQATLHALAPNYDFLDTPVTIIVLPTPTSLTLNGGAILVNSYYGDIVQLVVEYNDTFVGTRVTGASVTYVVGGLSGLLHEQPDGTYVTTVNTSRLSTGSLELSVIAARDGYATARRTVSFNVFEVPTVLNSTAPTLSGYYGDTVQFRTLYWDVHNDQPVVGASVTASWSGGPAVVTDLGNGTYLITVVVNVTNPRTYIVSVSMTVPNYATGTIELNLVMLRTPATILGVGAYSLPINETASLAFTVRNDLTDEIITDLVAEAHWQGIGIAPLTQMENGSYLLSVSGDLPIDTYRVDLVFSGPYYLIPVKTVQITVRQVLTTYYVSTQEIRTYPGASLEITVQYWDLDHNVGIDDADYEVGISGDGNLTFYPDFTRNTGNGTYVFIVQVTDPGTFYFVVTLSKDDFVSQQVAFTIYSSPSEAQIFAQNVAVYGGSSLVILALLLLLYVKVLSVPKMIRYINRMLGALKRGKVPKAPPVRSRQDVLLEMANEELAPVNLAKESEDVDGYPIKAVVPEVEELLEYLAQLTGLGDEEIEAFRSDLARMKPSERVGFLREVIAQEEQRRAEAIAEAEGKVQEVREPALAEHPEQLEELRRRLEQKGIGPDEIEIILEQAKTLSKADLEALLRSIGLDLD